MQRSRSISSFFEKTEHVFYPQYAVVTEQEFLERLLLEDPQDYVAITTLNEVDFEQEGTYKVLVGLQHLKTKKSHMRKVSLTVHSSSLGESILKMGYWRAYGFVLEGQLNKTVLSLKSKEDVRYSVILRDAYNQPVCHFNARTQNWYNLSKYDSYQLLIPNQTFKSLSIGRYSLQVHALEKSSGARVTSEVKEQEENSPLLIHSGLTGLTQGIESRIFGQNRVDWQTNSSGEVQIVVSAFEA